MRAGAGAGTRMIWTTLVSLALSGCGGGGASSPPSVSAPFNRVPSITSAASATFVENSTSVVYQATATDPDGDSLTLSLSGTDAARFTINGAGEVRFVSAPNFEKPADADADNAYTLQLSASDGKASVSQTVTITVTNSKEGITVQRVATGFDHPVAIAPIPGGNQLMVAERAGAIYIYDPATQQRTLFVTIAGLTSADNQGIISIAVHPDFPTRRVVYALFAPSTDGRIAVRQLSNFNGVTGFAEFVVARRILLSDDIAGWLGFGPNKVLYLAMGDPDGVVDANSAAQTLSSRLGKLLSFAGDFDPYAGASVGTPLTTTVLARGLRKPGSGSFYAGGLLLPDRGYVREEVNALPLTPGTSDNLGWPFRDGTVAYAQGEPAGLVPPVLEYPRGTGTYAGQGILGGLVYSGNNASLAGTYVFLDTTGAIFTVPLASLQRGTTLAASAFERRDLDFTPESGTITQPVAVTQDAAGAIYIVCDNGDIFRADAN